MLGFNLGELYVDDVASTGICNCLDAGCLTCSGRTVEHKSQRVRNTLLFVPVAVFQEKIDTILNLFALIKEYILKCASGNELGLGVDQVSRRQWILDRPLCLCLYHLIEVVAVSTQFVRHPALIIGITIVYKSLEVLDIVVVAIELEFDNFWSPICNLQVIQLKVYIVVQTDCFKLIGQVVVICHCKQTLHSRESCDKAYHCVHPGRVHCGGCRSVSVGLRLATPFTRNRCSRSFQHRMWNFGNSRLSRAPAPPRRNPR